MGHTHGEDDDEFLSTPSVGRATRIFLFLGMAVLFLSTPSVGRATAYRPLNVHIALISIHALRGEGDAGHHGDGIR